MDKNAIWKWLIFIALVAGSLMLVTPPSKKIRYGLDINGGSSFIVQIDEEQMREKILSENAALPPAEVDSAVKKALDGAQGRALEVIRNRVDNMGIAEPIIYPGKDNRIVVQLPGITEEKSKEAEETFRKVAFLEFRIVHKKNQELVEALFEKEKAPEGYRVAKVANIDCYQRDMSVPDEKMDPAFRNKLGRFSVPDAEYEFMLEKEVRENQVIYRPYFVKRRAELTGEYLKTAAVDYRDMSGTPVVDLTFDSKGAKIFGKVTERYAPEGDRHYMLAIVMDNTIYSAPRINEPIYGGRAEISGSFTVAEATLLSNVLRAGSLPAPVKIIERRRVDPSLGADAVRSGFFASIYGCLAIVILMGSYYMIPGLVANLALFLNIILLPLGMIAVAGFLELFSGGGKGAASAIALPVLTLPGIAGIALSIGMAVDANVLIFERMREELRAGKGFTGAIQAGYDRAFTAIFDSNVTTIITAIILFMLGGAGPIRGYAVTLTAGLLVSLYTAVVVTRMIFTAISTKTTNPNVLRMFSLFKVTNIDFMKPWKLAVAVSAIIIIGSWTVMVSRGMKDATSVFGVDFTGGSALTLSFKDKVPVEDIRSTLSDAGFKDASIQYQSQLTTGGNEYLEVKIANAASNEKEATAGAIAAKALIERFPAAEFKKLQEDDVGPQIGKELKLKAMKAMLWSLVAMVIYIWFRFELGFGLGAVVALFHDVLITAGIIHLLGFQINMTIIAGLMTIVGYSVNDTIVIFDRIREDLRLVRNKSFLEICNLSMNQTLSRTIITNFLTFVSVLFLVTMGGGAIKDFSVTMFIGMIAGTYSTMYIATPVVLAYYKFKTPDLGGSKSIVK